MHTLKYKDEWPLLIRLANENHLTKEQIIFLLALREVESGEKGNEFNVRAANGTDLQEQALWAIGTIKKNEKRHQKCIIETGNVDYISFYACLGGPYGSGWATITPWSWIINMYKYIKIIKKES